VLIVRLDLFGGGNGGVRDGVEVLESSERSLEGCHCVEVGNFLKRKKKFSTNSFVRFEFF